MPPPDRIVSSWLFDAASDLQAKGLTDSCLDPNLLGRRGTLWDIHAVDRGLSKRLQHLWANQKKVPRGGKQSLPVGSMGWTLALLHSGSLTQEPICRV